MTRFARVLAILIPLLLLAARAGGLYPDVAGPAGEYLLDARNGQTLVMLLPSRELALRTPGGGGLARLGVTAFSARFLPDGQIVFVDISLALRRLGPKGPQDWLPPGSANAPLFLSPDGQTLAYLKPIDQPAGDNEPTTNGVAVLNLATGAERVLYQVPDITIHLYGWVGQQLLVEVPNWSPATRAPASTMVLSLLNTDAPQTAPMALASLPAVLPGAHYPQTSLDQGHLAYEAANGLVVASLADGRYGLFQGADPLWTPAGLTSLVKGQRANLAWAAADLTRLSPTSGPVTAPQTSVPTVPSPKRPAAPKAILLYRPVKASTPVSAYMDLDYNVGSIRDWTGWTGTHWAWGHAYDQHKGTDYAAPIGNAIYAAAPGTVDRVVIDCVNTYPGGPGTFGSYVRIDHGTQSDGFNYKTLYGHLKCDAVFSTVGDVVATLPTQLAELGNTGYSTGPHTHLQVFRNDVTVDPYSSGIISDNPPLSTIGNLDGLVRDANGQPAAGATVKIASGGLYQTVVTGADGTYHFTAVRVGATTPTAVRGVRWGQAAANIAAAQNVTAPDITLDQCGGTTVGADGCPAVNYDDAAFLADVTAPDTGVVLPSVPLTKTWRLRNIGTSAWGAGYQLVFIGGTTLAAAPAAVDVPATQPNGSVDLSAAFTAPADPGVHRAYWRLRNPSGTYFGPSIWAELNTQPAGAGITVFSADPPSPSSSSLVHIHALAGGVPNFRALRLLIDGGVVTETTAVELFYDWPAAGLDPVEHSLVVQAADQIDVTWTHPQYRGLNYALQPISGTASLALEQPVTAGPEDWAAAPDTTDSSAANAPNDPASPGCAVQSLPALSATKPFSLTWSVTGVIGPAMVDVQYLDSGRGIWRDWLRQVASNTASFSGQLGHRYGFRCRATDQAGSQGSYPGVANTTTLLGAQTGLADLRVLNLTAVPNPTGGALAQVTIQNNSTVGTQRGFYVDLYEDHVPSGVGDFTGSVHAWATAPLGPGATVVLSAIVPQAIGQHVAFLDAQVDSTGVVDESDKSNNVWAGGTGACVAAADAYEHDNSRATAKPLPSGSSQAHTFGGPGDQDWMLLDAQPGHFYQFTTSNLAPGVDTRLTIYGADGASPLSTNDDVDGTTLASKLLWVPPAPGPYYLVAQDWNPGAGGCDSGYTVSAQDLGPGFVLFLPLLWK